MLDPVPPIQVLHALVSVPLNQLLHALDPFLPTQLVHALPIACRRAYSLKCLPLVLPDPSGTRRALCMNCQRTKTEHIHVEIGSTMLTIVNFL